MPALAPRHTVVRLPLNAERPIGVSVTEFSSPQPGPEFDMHYGLEMGVVLQGRMRRWSGDAHYDLERGQPWFVGMWEPHGAQAASVPCRVLVVTIWPPLLAGLRFVEAPGVDWMRPFACEHTAPLVPDAPRRKELLRLAAELASTGNADALARCRQRLLLLETLALILAMSGRDAPGAMARRPPGGIAPALELALSQQRPIRVDEAARSCGMGRERFMRAFRAHMGVSFAQFALRHRLHGAAAELVATDEPIKAVAWHWGFTDESHLHRHFVRHYRCTPKDYRKRGEDRSDVRATESRSARRTISSEKAPSPIRSRP